jgi:hypothetical protein
MTFEQQIPQEFVALAVQALTNDQHSIAQAILLMLVSPSVAAQELSHAPVDASLTAWYSAAIKCDLPNPRSPITTTGALIGADCFDTLQKVMGRIRDLQELLRGNLCCTGVGVVGELNGCPLRRLPRNSSAESVQALLPFLIIQLINGIYHPSSPMASPPLIAV